MRNHKFLHLIHRYYPFRGGSEYYFQSLSEQLANEGADVHLITTDAWDLEYFWNPARQRIDVPFEQHNEVKIHRVPAKHLPAANLSHRAIRRAMGEISRVPIPGSMSLLSRLARFGPWLPALRQTLEDVARGASLIHPANIALESIISDAADYAARYDIPLVITPKLHLGENQRSAVRRYYTMPHQLELLRQADMIMTQTSLEADFLNQHGVSDKRLRVVGLGIDTQSVTGGNESRVREELNVQGPIVLALGAAAYDKGTVHACQAVLQLNHQRTEPITLVVAGPIMSNFEQFIDQLPDEHREWIRVLGYVEDDFRTDLLAAADALTLASRTEAFGYVFLEAWANALPVIGARAGGIPAVIDDGENGVLVDFGNVPQLADAIGKLIDDRTFARSLGEAGRSKVVDRAEWYQKVRNVYSEVLGIETEAEGSIGGQAAVGRSGT